MKRLWLVLLAGALMAWNASAQSPTSKQSEGSQEAKPSSQPSSKKGSGAKASGNASGSSSTSASAQAGQNSTSLSAGTTFEAALAGSLDARKNKEGDQVVAHTTQAVKSDGQVVIPKGSKLIGHVTQAKARAKGESESALGIVFDKAVLKNGQEMPIHVAVQALAAAQTETAAALDAGEGMTHAGTMGSATGSGRASGSDGGVVGGAGSTVSGAAGAVTNTAGGGGQHRRRRRWRDRQHRRFGHWRQRGRPANFVEHRRDRFEGTFAELGGVERHDGFTDRLFDQERAPGQRHAHAAARPGAVNSLVRTEACSGDAAPAVVGAASYS